MVQSATAASASVPGSRLRLVAAILVGVIGPEVFIVQPGLRAGPGAESRFRRAQRRIRRVDRSVGDHAHHPVDDVLLAALQLAQRDLGLAAAGRSQQRLVHRRTRQTPIPAAAFPRWRRCGQPHLPQLHYSRAHRASGPQFRLPDHVGAAVRRGRVVSDAGRIRLQWNDRRARVFRRVPADGAAARAGVPAKR